jgi:ATP-dependent Lon protease
MPGRLIQSLKRAGTRNPLMLLDEIDKLRADYHGDPSAAMLEVLDPEQNKTFTDHYLDIPFDLSDVFFIATSNVLDTIPPPLRDRMEIIEVNGYTSMEKLEIAKRHLVPKLLSEHGLKTEWLRLPDETLQKIISHYTREAGVRELQRKIASLFRAAAEEVIEQQEKGTSQELLTPIDLPPGRLRALIGPERYFPEVAERVTRPGIATGLAWTPQGGEILFIEASSMPRGKGSLTLTGQLGDVMKESAQIALSLARSTASHYFHKGFDFGTTDLHIHVPAGAIPKDGPSAGVTIMTALASLIIGKPVRQSLAMTGEITLRGAILPVGGIKEKVLAAHRAELKTLIIPKRNEQDLEEVPEDVRKELNFVLVETVEEVLAYALEILPLRFGTTSQGPNRTQEAASNPAA